MSTNAPKDQSNSKWASRNARLLVVTLGVLLLAGCDAPPTQDVTTQIASNTVSTPANDSLDNAPSLGVPENSQNTKAVSISRDLPADVTAFKTRRDDCDHFRGEDPGDDEARAAELTSKLEHSCKGTDADLASLRRHYAGDARVTSALANYEDSVE